MGIFSAIVDASRRLFGADSAPQIEEVEIFEAKRGVWKIRCGASVIGNFDSRERARRTAQDWNLLTINKQNSKG